MEKERLLNTLKNYEKQNTTEEGENANDADTIRVLINDINRIEFDFANLSEDKRKTRLYKNILYEVLKDFPVRYIQGMAEVATVIVTAYFSGQVEKFKFNTDALNTTSTGAVPFKFTNKAEKEELEKFMADNHNLMQSMRRALISIYRERFLIFFEDNFKLYRELNNAFIAVMAKKGVKLDKDESFKYMNHILTFFKRILDNENAAYSVYNIILSAEPAMLFTLLIMFYGTIQGGQAASGIEFPKKVADLDNDFVKALSQQHEMLMKARDEAKLKKGKSGYLFFGAALSAVAVAVLFYKMNDSK